MDMLANALSRLLPAEKEGFEQLLLEKGDGAAGRVMYVLRHNNRTNDVTMLWQREGAAAAGCELLPPLLYLLAALVVNDTHNTRPA